MATADHNLLLGLTALQIDFIDRDALVEGMLAWQRDKQKTMLEVLQQQGQIDQRQAELLENLVQEHIRRSGGTAEDGLVALSTFSTVAPLLRNLEDSEVSDALQTVTQRRIVNHASDVNNGSGSTRANRTGALASRDPGRSRFRVLRTHARGGLGQVYLAEDEELHRNVALKEILAKYADEPENRQRFMVEAEITGRLQHPGIVPVYGLGIYPDGRPFYAMRFIEGDNLLTAIRSFHHQTAGKPWTGEMMVAFRELLGRFMDVCDAMQFAHQRHVLHRDLKPHNIMLGEHGETLVVDWGLAKPLYEGQLSAEVPEEAIVPVSGTASGSEREGSILGTPDYMPPEQAAGRLSQLSIRSDVYSLGATLYHLLTNQPPFQPKPRTKAETTERISTDALLQRVLAGEFAAPQQVQPHVPRPLGAICKKAMALRPEDRYESARELKSEIQRWLADEPISAMPETWYDRMFRWFRRHRQLSLIGGASIVLVGVVTVAALLAINHFRAKELQAANISQFSSQLDGLIAQSESKNQLMGQAFYDQQFDPILKKLQPLARDLASQRENRALQTAADIMQAKLTESTPSNELLTEISREIEFWAGRRIAAGESEKFEALEKDLRELLKNRQAPWNTLPALTGGALLSSLSLTDNLTLTTENMVAASEELQRFNFSQLSVTQLPANLNHEIAVRFAEQSLDLPALVVALNPQSEEPQENQYQAILCVEGFQPNRWSKFMLRDLKTLRQIAQEGRPARLLLARGRSVLNEVSVNLGLGDVMLSLRREDDRLRAVCEPSVGSRAMVEYSDFLSLPYGQQPGIWFGPKTSILSTTLAYRARPRQLSPIEAIKEDVNSGRLDKALEKLSTQTGREADYLRSRCLTQEAERLAILDEILSRAPEIDYSGVVQDRWHLPALLDAIELNRGLENAERFRDLVAQLTNYYGSSIESVTIRIPKGLRDKLISEYRKSGGRWRIATQSTADTPMLDTAVLLDDLLEPNKAVQRATRWRRCDAWRVTGRQDKALAELRKLLDESLADPLSPAGEVANLVTDICWVLLAQSSLNEVETFLSEMSQTGQLDAAAKVSLQIETARLAIHQKRLADATEMLVKLLVREAELSVAQYVDVCLLAGFVQHDQGNSDQAQEIWKKGLVYQGRPIQQANKDAASLHGTEAIEHQCIVTLYGTLASLTNGFTTDSAMESFDAQIPKDGGFGAAGRSIVETVFDDEFVRDIANAIFQSERGNSIARRRAYHFDDLGPYFTEPIRLLVFEGVIVKHLEAHRQNQALMEDAWNACEQLFLTYDSRGIGEQDDMRTIIALWSGQSDLQTWRSLEPKVTRDVAAGLALISGMAHITEANEAESDSVRVSHLRKARTMLDVARTHSGATQNFIQLANQLLGDLPDHAAE